VTLKPERLIRRPAREAFHVRFARCAPQRALGARKTLARGSAESRLEGPVVGRDVRRVPDVPDERAPRLA
jgi:hypothetical protein